MDTDDRIKVNADRWAVTLKRVNRPTLTVTIPTLNEALAIARVDAAWYGGAARVHVSPLIPSEAKGV